MMYDRTLEDILNRILSLAKGGYLQEKKKRAKKSHESFDFDEISSFPVEKERERKRMI